MQRLIVWTAVIVLVVVALVLVMAGRGITAAGHRPWPFEERVARAAWRFMVPREVRRTSNPVTATADVLKGARAHWADHCALCHDNDGSGDTPVGRRVYPPVPDLRGQRTQALTDGELFYAIEHGIPWTAMPGWTTNTHEGEMQSWALVRLIRHLPSITPDELREMERLNPKPPVNPQEEKEIEDFLKGPAKKGRSE
ncbi:MAG TPA: cytochrome c [Vicinamibacterales bacterium]|nr:cytochrome c [Vicinamibacterales bacterium]